jgi:hypothetical protein
VVVSLILSRASRDDITYFILFQHPSHPLGALFNDNEKNVHKSGGVFHKSRSNVMVKMLMYPKILCGIPNESRT